MGVDKYTAITTLKKSIVSGVAKEILALELFQLQYAHNEVYRRWCTLLKLDPYVVQRMEDIPYLPIRFFKQFEVSTRLSESPRFVFRSSGTTASARSQTLVYDPDWYTEIALRHFMHWIPTVSSKPCRFFSLLPGYSGRPDSSLLFMVEQLAQRLTDKECTLFLGDYASFHQALAESYSQGYLPVVWVVSHALLHWIREPIAADVRSIPMLIVETGGMKGLEKEIVRKQLHQMAQDVFEKSTIRSEYGMTELCSQAYTNVSDLFQIPDTMFVRTRMLNDPFTASKSETAGVLQIIDLANVDTCAFIELEDIGIVYKDNTFDVLGRVDDAEARGCNLLLAS